MLFLIVSAVRDPTVSAPSSSKTVARTIAHRYEIDLEETEVAQALATSSAFCQQTPLERLSRHTSAIVVGIKQRKERANDEDVGVLCQHLALYDIDRASLLKDLFSALACTDNEILHARTTYLYMLVLYHLRTTRWARHIGLYATKR